MKQHTFIHSYTHKQKTEKMFANLDSIMQSNFALSTCPRTGPFCYQNFNDAASACTNLSAASSTILGADADSAIRHSNDSAACIGVLPTHDPLDSRNVLVNTICGNSSYNNNDDGDYTTGVGEERRCWKLTTYCPVPRAIPPLKLKKGTTTLGMLFDGGIIIAVDSRASTGQYIASQTVMKVL